MQTRLKYRYMVGDRQENRIGVLCKTQKGNSIYFNKPGLLKQERLNILLLCDNMSATIYLFIQHRYPSVSLLEPPISQDKPIFTTTVTVSTTNTTKTAITTTAIIISNMDYVYRSSGMLYRFRG